MFKIATITLAMLFSVGMIFIMTFVAIPSALSVEEYNAPEAAVEEGPSTDSGELSTYYDDSQDEKEMVGEEEALEQEGDEENEQLQYEEEVTE